MRDLSSLTKKEQKAVANWLNKGACGCPFNVEDERPKNWDELELPCDSTCGTVFPECQDEIPMLGGIIRTITHCPCHTLGDNYVISELGGLPHD